MGASASQRPTPAKDVEHRRGPEEGVKKVRLRWGRLSEPAWIWTANHLGTQASSESLRTFSDAL
jgi:hypothetical protein